jgi:hypothetical protein
LVWERSGSAVPGGRERVLKVRERGGKRVGSGTLPDRARSRNLGSGARFGRSGARSGARFGRSGARSGARFRDAPARSADRGSGPGGGRFGNTGPSLHVVGVSQLAMTARTCF